MSAATLNMGVQKLMVEGMGRILAGVSKEVSIKYTLSSRARSAWPACSAFMPSVRASKGILHTTTKFDPKQKLIGSLFNAVDRKLGAEDISIIKDVANHGPFIPLYRARTALLAVK